MPERPRYPRSTCAVPGCARWSTLFRCEWVCGQHWKAVDRGLKRFRKKRLAHVLDLVARYEGLTHAAQLKLAAGSGPESDVWKWANKGADALKRYHQLERWTWERMKRQAIFAAAGL